jgi:ATP-dependent exoDNAse (exonuclease V) beta subunit
VAVPEVAGGVVTLDPPDTGLASDDLAPLDREPDRWSAAAVAGATPVDDTTVAAESDALLGTLVHRLLQRLGAFNPAGMDVVEEAARRAVRLTDNVAQAALPALVARAARLYMRAREHPQVASIYGSSAVWHEVPFSTTDAGRLVRGTIDCIACTNAGELTVLEFKTGRPRAWHDAQLRLYQKAVAQLFPERQVRAELVYLGPAG